MYSLQWVPMHKQISVWVTYRSPVLVMHQSHLPGLRPRHAFQFTIVQVFLAFQFQISAIQIEQSFVCFCIVGSAKLWFITKFNEFGMKNPNPQFLFDICYVFKLTEKRLNHIR